MDKGSTAPGVTIGKVSCFALEVDEYIESLPVQPTLPMLSTQSFPPQTLTFQIFKLDPLAARFLVFGRWS
jgi:hypothetical protein